MRAKFIPIFAVFIDAAIWARGTMTHIAPPNTLSFIGTIHACSFVATLTVTIIYWAAFVTQNFVTVVTNTHWLAIVTRRLTAFRTRHDWTTFATEHLLTGPAHFYVTLGRILFYTVSTEAMHALIASKVLQAIIHHPFLSFAASIDALIALGAITTCG